MFICILLYTQALPANQEMSSVTFGVYYKDLFYFYLFICIYVLFTSSTSSKYHHKIMNPAMMSELHIPIPSLTLRTNPLQGPLETSVQEPSGYI